MNRKRLASVLAQIAKGVISRADAAEALACSERSVNREMQNAGVTRPASPVHRARAAAASRREAKQCAAREVIEGSRTPEQAAKAAETSVRTIYRWVERLNSAEKVRKTREKRRKSA